MHRPLRLTRLVTALLGGLLVAGLAACGSDDSAAESGDATKLDSPVTVEHRFGKTTIDTVPKRIVTIDLQWTDVMLAMGVEPVGYTVDSLMPDSKVPWQKPPSGAKALELTDGVPVEQVLALNPDLVLGSFSIDTEETYKLLSDRVPTVAGPPDNRQVTSWQDMVRTAGKFLNEPEKAEQVIKSVDDEVTGVAKELPGLKDRTFSLAQYIVGDSMVIVADEKDGSSVFFQQLGMKLNPTVVSEGQKTGQARVTVSTERADLLRADFLAFLVNGGDESDLSDIAGFDQLPGTVAVLDYATVVGLNTPTPLSIPYALEKLKPFLEEAAA
jgi:iron complex transport system substrate-binding protein